MSFFIPTASIHVNKQLGFEYSMILAIASHFKSARIMRSPKATTMKVNYAEMSKDLKAQMKELCASFAEEALSEIPDKNLDSDVKVVLVRRNDGRQEIDFWGNGFVLRLICNYAGANSLIKTEYRVKRGAF